jgi:Protein of unknown function (DUF3891)
MMVQSALPGEASFVSTMAEHNDLCGQFARAFGNNEFEPLHPLEEMLYVVSHHDYGWNDWDASPTLDSAGLPSGIGGVPGREGVEANRKSPEVNERHSAFCGLLSSMHSWGLFHNRYGLSSFRVRAGGSRSVQIPEDYRQGTEAFFAGEEERQKRLRAQLASDPGTAAWVEEKKLFQCYKQLQFFDTLALYFNLRHESQRGEQVYTHVPRRADEDATVIVRKRENSIYSFAPFPFRGEQVEVACAGRYVKPFPEKLAPEQVGAALRALPTVRQTYTFVPG